MIKNIEKIYQDIYNITVEISSLIEKDDLDGISAALNKKDSLIAEVNNAKKEMNISQSENLSINEIIKKIKLIEDKNLKELEIKYKTLENNISKISTNSKALSAYKINKQVDPRLFDARE